MTSEDILARVSPTADTKYGVEVMRVGIAEYTLPPDNPPSVIQRMIAERARIEAIAVKEHDQLMADAHAKATTILGNAEAKAMALLGAAYSEDPEFYKFLRALDSYDSIIDKNTTLILPADNELFKYLDSNEIPLPEQRKARR